MSDINTFLKILSKVGYPNPKTVIIADAVSYDLENFLEDLNEKLGEEKLLDFVRTALSKISTDKGIKADSPETGEFIYFDIVPIRFDEDENNRDYAIEGTITDSRIKWMDEMGRESIKKIEEIETDFSSWSEYDEMMDYFKIKLFNKIFQNCGFGVWWV